jgi:carbon-monoxide dehydrogenase large subunit
VVVEPELHDEQLTSPAVGAASTLGRSVRRREDARILSGRSRYLDDIVLPDTAHMVFVRSPYAHARVVSIEGARWTAADIAGRAVPARAAAPPALSVDDLPHPLLAEGEVHYVGQPVAAVVAGSRALAEDAADRVQVAYEPLEPVDDSRAGATLMRWEKREGDVPAAFRAAAHVVRAEHVIPRLVTAPPEPRGALAQFDGSRLTVWSSSQSAHRPRAQLAQILGRRETSIRVVVPDVGGGFGAKGTLPVETPLVALAAIELGRPVRWSEDRRENDESAPQARGLRAAVELALDADGRILALRARLLADVGAYLLPSTPFPAHAAAMSLAGAYDIQAVEVIVTGARTHKVPAGPFRGSEACQVIETTIDAAARELGIDPVELRRRNLVREFPYRTALGWTYDSGDFERCLDRAVELIADAPPAPARARTDWSAPPAALEPDEPRDVLVGTGVALSVHRSGGLYETAEVRAGEDGEVLVLVGSGPGYETLFAQIAADRLGVDPERVTVRTGDTDALADGVGSHASRTTAMGGSAVAAAVDDLRANGGTVGRARFESDQVFGSGAYAAVVEVDRATGAVRVRRFVAVDDAGRIVNPLLAEGQVVGGTVQGLGACLTGGLLTAAEVPELATAFVESPSPLNPLGAKGISDGAAGGAPAAVANALANALGRHLDPPFTAEKVWQALQ